MKRFLLLFMDFLNAKNISEDVEVNPEVVEVIFLQTDRFPKVFLGKSDTLIWALDRKSFHFWLLPKIQSAPTLLGCNPTFCKEFEIALLLWSTGGGEAVVVESAMQKCMFFPPKVLFFSTAETLKYRKVSQSMWLLRWWLRKLHHGWHAAISQFFNGRREECAEIDENCS